MDVRARALLEAIRAEPDDDEPRLVWADHVGGERGELVVLQCQLARGGLTLEETLARRQRERALLEAHGAAWAGLEGLRVEHHAFRRGFVDAVTMDARRLVAHGPELVERVPLLRSVRVTGLQGDVLPPTRWRQPAGDISVELARQALGVLPGIEAISFVDPRLIISDIPDEPAESRGDEVLALIARTAPPGLRRLGIEAVYVGDDGVAALISSGVAAGLEALELAYSDNVRPATWLRLCDAAPGLRSLVCSLRPGFEARLLDALPALERLAIQCDHVLRVRLARNPRLAGLRALRLRGRGFDLAELAAFPQLEELALTIEDLFALLRAPLPALRRMHLMPWFEDHAVQVAEAHGAKLEYLALPDRVALRIVEKCQPHVAGEVVRRFPIRYL